MKRVTTSSSGPCSATSAARLPMPERRRGAASGRSTSSGIGSNVSTVERAPAACADVTASPIRRWWPRCTPSNVPSATTRGPPPRAASSPCRILMRPARGRRGGAARRRRGSAMATSRPPTRQRVGPSSPRSGERAPVRDLGELRLAQLARGQVRERVAPGRSARAPSRSAATSSSEPAPVDVERARRPCAAARRSRRRSPAPRPDRGPARARRSPSSSAARASRRPRPRRARGCPGRRARRRAAP